MFAVFLWTGVTSLLVHATEFHVSVSGHDSNTGTSTSPFRTIQHAADLAEPGDIITVHAGVYRERVNPAHGGSGPNKPIIYQAAVGEKVRITGAETVTGWRQVSPGVWSVKLPNAFFGSFNPYADKIHGDWYKPKGRELHTGAVFLDGQPLQEANKSDEVIGLAKGAISLWFATVDADKTTIVAQLGEADPNGHVEIVVRQTVFYPSKTGMNYITVRGFELCDAATPWAPPTAEQIGLLGVNWSKGWIIEDNVIHDSSCSGVSLGKYGDEWDNQAESAPGYVETIQRALEHGWNRATVGSHVVRHNEIYRCGQAGVVGSMGCAYSTVIDNHIHDIDDPELLFGAEMAGIKFHGAIDVQIVHNRVDHCQRGLWLDWMAQGTRVSRNLFYDNLSQDIFLEVNHGPDLIDNNLLLSSTSLMTWSNGGAFVHNLITGKFIRDLHQVRQTPFLKPHDTVIAGLHDIDGGDERVYNNLFVRNADLTVYDHLKLPAWFAGNVYLFGAKPCHLEKDPVVDGDPDPEFHLEQRSDGLYLIFRQSSSWSGTATHPLVTTALLGQALLPQEGFENADGSALKIDSDYLGLARSNKNPFPGPLELTAQAGIREIKVW